MTQLPPQGSASGHSLVPRVDSDGNETVGVGSVQHRVPLGSYRDGTFGRAASIVAVAVVFRWLNIPFASTRAERLAAQDPRPSLEERYHHAGFVARVSSAAQDLVKERLLLPDDAQEIVRHAQASNVLDAGSAALDAAQARRIP